MRISDWSSDVCSSDLDHAALGHVPGHDRIGADRRLGADGYATDDLGARSQEAAVADHRRAAPAAAIHIAERSEEHTSELQSLMRISYAVFCLKKKKQSTTSGPYTQSSVTRSNKAPNTRSNT